VKLQDGGFAYIWFSFVLRRQQMIVNRRVILIGRWIIYMSTCHIQNIVNTYARDYMNMCGTRRQVYCW